MAPRGEADIDEPAVEARVSVFGGILSLLSAVIPRLLKWRETRSSRGTLRVFDANALLGPRVRVDTVEHSGVKWPIFMAGSPFHKEDPLTDPRARPRPLCPECGCELKQARRPLRGYRWDCVECGFSVRSRRSFHQIAEDVTILARHRHAAY